MLDALTLDQLRVFVSIADSGSFRAAARSLGRAQSGLSSAIANLETELRVVLFDRSQHRPVLTEAGATLLAEARTLLIRADAFRARANSFHQGVEAGLRVALDPLLSLPKVARVVSRFHLQFPSVRLELDTTPMTSALAMVLDGRCDLGLTAADEQDAHIASEVIGEIDGMIAVCRADHPLAGREAGETWTTVDLSGHLQIVISDPSARSQGRNFGVLSQKTYRVGDLATKHALILAGVGWGNLPLWIIADDISAGRLARVALAAHRAGEPAPLTLYAISRIDRPFGPAASGLCRMLSDDFGRRRTRPAPSRPA
ncbi:LysR family transcriptional regulator [Phreatobacter stygius]|uniref:LysR family transcriptional regulator n=1 Tax=Phreatobacter stygius TaxID=1940610 RepID=A0A4D7BJU4_9HYPH|nr:LysR family transcriptional regulator [Phreatobacter stygius]QCI67987.1 LysR family transcriptional regulator [Phreatobacter stygius]